MPGENQILKLSGAQKAALFLMLLSRDEASRLSLQLKPTDRSKIGAALSTLPSIENTFIGQLVGEFVDNYQASAFISPIEEMSKILSYDSGRPDAVETKSAVPRTSTGEGNAVTDERIRDFVQHEPAEIVARLLDILPEERSADFLAQLDTQKRTEVFLAFVQRRKLSDVLENTISTALLELVEIERNQKSDNGFAGKVASIVNQMPDDLSEQLFALLETNEPQLAADVANDIFRFPMFEKFDRKSRTLISDVLDMSDVAKALMGADASLQESMLEILSPRNRRMVESEMTAGGAEEAIALARKRIVKRILDLIRSGKIEPVFQDGDKEK